MYPSIVVASVVQAISGLNYLRKGMPKIPSASQSKTSKVNLSHTFVPSYNSTYAYPKILTSELSANATIVAELCFISNPHLLQVAKDKKL